MQLLVPLTAWVLPPAHAQGEAVLRPAAPPPPPANPVSVALFLGRAHSVVETKWSRSRQSLPPTCTGRSEPPKGAPTRTQSLICTRFISPTDRPTRDPPCRAPHSATAAAMPARGTALLWMSQWFSTRDDSAALPLPWGHWAMSEFGFGCGDLGRGHY